MKNAKGTPYIKIKTKFLIFRLQQPGGCRLSAGARRRRQCTGIHLVIMIIFLKREFKIL